MISFSAVCGIVLQQHSGATSEPSLTIELSFLALPPPHANANTVRANRILMPEVVTRPLHGAPRRREQAHDRPEPHGPGGQPCERRHDRRDRQPVVLRVPP